MQNNHAHLCIIVPCYNPPETWAPAFVENYRALQSELKDSINSVEIVVVNDGHIEGHQPAALAQLATLAPDIRMVSYAENRGKGYALRQGVAAAQGDLYLITDADFPYTLGSMKAIVQHLQHEGGIAAGNRDLAYYAHVPLFRKVLSKSLRFLLRHLLRLQVTDSQCGLKGFDNAGKAIFLQTTIDRFLFDLEFLVLAKNRVKVLPVPVELRPGVVFSKVGWKILATEMGNFLKIVFER